MDRLNRWTQLMQRASAQMQDERYDAAAQTTRQALALAEAHPEMAPCLQSTIVYLAACCRLAGREEEAAALQARVTPPTTPIPRGPDRDRWQQVQAEPRALIGPATIKSSGGCMAHRWATLWLSPSSPDCVLVELENPLCFYEASDQVSTTLASDEVAGFLGVLCALLDDPQRGRCSTRAAVIDVDLPLVDGRMTRSVREDEGTPPVDPILGLLCDLVSRLHSSD